MTGEADAIARVRTQDNADLERLIMDLQRDGLVERTRSQVVLSRLVSPGWNLVARRATTLPRPCQGLVASGPCAISWPPRASAYIVYDGGMGATLEQFDLSLEHDYRLPGRCHEVLVLNRPDVIEGVHTSMLDAGAEVLETDTFQASRLKLSEWGLDEHT